MRYETLKIVRKLENGRADCLDVKRLGELADEGDPYASLEYGICLYLGEQVLEDKDRSFIYFEKASKSDDFNILVELVSFMNYFEDSRFNELIDVGMKKIRKKMEDKGKELGIDINNLRLN